MYTRVHSCEAYVFADIVDLRSSGGDTGGRQAAIIPTLKFEMGDGGASIPSNLAIVSVSCW